MVLCWEGGTRAFKMGRSWRWPPVRAGRQVQAGTKMVLSIPCSPAHILKSHHHDVSDIQLSTENEYQGPHSLDPQISKSFSHLIAYFLKMPDSRRPHKDIEDRSFTLKFFLQQSLTGVLYRQGKIILCPGLYTTVMKSCPIWVLKKLLTLKSHVLSAQSNSLGSGDGTKCKKLITT